MNLLFIINCVYLYNIQNFFSFSNQWLFYTDYWYINKYLCLNWFIRIQFYLLIYCKFFLYLWLNIFINNKMYFIEKKEKYHIVLHFNLIFLMQIARKHYLFWNLLFMIVFSQLGFTLYFFQQYFSYSINIYYRWLNILYIL
jgi:hypothetical protein